MRLIFWKYQRRTCRLEVEKLNNTISHTHFLAVFCVLFGRTLILYHAFNSLVVVLYHSFRKRVYNVKLTTIT